MGTIKIMNETLFLRPADLQRLHDALAEGACCSIVGLSNIGKSMLLRTAAEENRARTLNVYVDCNLMPALTDQSFYEVTLRAVLDAVKRLGKKVPVEVVNRLEALCRQVIDAERPIVPALSFNDGISLLCEQLDRRVALLFDEFDDPFGALDGRVFLNLRALHDKFESLVYVTATGAPLAERRRDVEAGEFCELFVGHQIGLGHVGRGDGAPRGAGVDEGRRCAAVAAGSGVHRGAGGRTSGSAAERDAAGAALLVRCAEPVARPGVDPGA